MDEYTPSTLEIIQGNLPDWYKKYKEDGSVLYALINAFSTVLDECHSNVERIDDAIGVATTHDEDLYHVWGSILGIYRNNTSYSLYRHELQFAFPSLVGGTIDAIRYAIALVMGVETNDQLQTDYIIVMDAWKYTGDIVIDKSIGNFLCLIDLNIGSVAPNIEQEIIDAVNKVKASGTKAIIRYIGLHITEYNELSNFTYSNISDLRYDQL